MAPADQIHFPEALTDPDQAFPVAFVDCRGMDLNTPAVTTRVNRRLSEALNFAHGGGAAGQALVKVHIGEPKCSTRMRPAFMASSRRFLEDRGMKCAAGDTTVAYTGSRGHRENPPGHPDAYLSLARKHGWSEEGEAELPFVVLDRPETSLPGRFEFREEETLRRLAGIERYGDFYSAGGFEAARFIINHAHLTFHTLAGFAGCVKSIAMGCSSLKGKLRMHQAMLPAFDEEKCSLCGLCVENCPEGALRLEAGAAVPRVDPEHCIGCGECAAVCARQAARLRGGEITDWKRGGETFSCRMADYAAGLLNGKWEHTIHVLHLYDITALCDCVDRKQKPLIKDSPGFLAGKNPFAVDAWGARLLSGAAEAEGAALDPQALKAARQSESYAREKYGIVSAPSLDLFHPEKCGAEAKDAGAASP